MAWLGHSGSHTSQLMHTSVILSAKSLSQGRAHLGPHKFGYVSIEPGNFFDQGR